MSHSLIRGVLIQSCPTRAKNFTNYVFCHVQFSGVVIQKTDFYSTYKIGYFDNNQHRQIGFKNGTTIFNILDNTTELWMTKYIIGEIFSSGRATLCKNPSNQTVWSV